TLSNVDWDSPAFKAGLVPGMDLLAVNGETYTPDKLKQAILQAEKETTPINLLMKDRDQIKPVTVDYHGGMRYPHLERVEGAPDRLDAILQPVD
ncbi:MAG: peptidase M61, partial [Acidobacteriaceae bacterium]